MTQMTHAALERSAALFKTLAVTLGAFGVGALATTALSLILARLGAGRADAVTIALMAGPIICAVISLAAFHGRSVIRVWGWLAGAAGSFAVLIVALSPGAPA